MNAGDHTAPENWPEIKGLPAAETSGDCGYRELSSGELAAICRSRMGEPVFVDLAGFDLGAGARLRALAHGQGLLLTSFADLFHHPFPPIELLETVKSFAKANAKDPQSPYAKEVSLLLYYESIAAALVKLGKRITRLSREQVLEGFDWVLSQAWIDGRDRELLEQARKVVATG